MGNTHSRSGRHSAEGRRIHSANRVFPCNSREDSLEMSAGPSQRTRQNRAAVLDGGGVVNVYGGNVSIESGDGKKMKRTQSSGRHRIEGITCEAIPESSNKILRWKPCHDANAKYVLEWSRNYKSLQSLTSMSPEITLYHLKPGNYFFQVSTEDEHRSISEPCFLKVPDSPTPEVKEVSFTCVKVTWKHVDAEAHYVVGIRGTNFVAKTEDDVLRIDENVFAFEPGLLYAITVQACLHGHFSSTAKTSFCKAPKCPEVIQCKLDRSQPTSTVHISWMPSQGMRQARLELTDSQRATTKHMTTINTWTCSGLKENEKYEVKLWPGDGEKFSTDFGHASETFVTAPGPPCEVKCRLSPHSPETEMEVMISSEYEGPYVIVADGEGMETVTTETTEKTAVIKNLQPGQAYIISAQCKFTKWSYPDPYLSGKTLNTSYYTD